MNAQCVLVKTPEHARTILVATNAPVLEGFKDKTAKTVRRLLAKYSTLPVKMH